MALSSARLETGASYQSSTASTALRGPSEDLADLRLRLCDEHDIYPIDFAILKAMTADSGAMVDDLAVAGHCSVEVARCAVDRLHARRLAKVRGFGPRATRGMAGRGETWGPGLLTPTGP